MRPSAFVCSPRVLLAGFGLLSLCLLPLACKSSAEQRAAADKEVYGLVASRRTKLGFGGQTFTIEPNPDSLRQRILRKEVQQLEPLDLARLLEIAAENSRDYQSNKEDLYLSALDLTLEHWRHSIETTNSIDAGVDGTGDGAQNANAGANLGFSKLFASGGTALFNMGTSMARSLTFADGWHPVTDLGFNFTQPLLRGFGERIVLETLTQAERNLLYQVRDFERYRRTYAVDAAGRYYKLLQNMNVVENQESNYKSLQQLTQRNEALAQAGRLSDIELGQARQNELRSRDDLIAARARLDTQLDSLKVFLGLPPTFELGMDRSALEQLAGEKLAEEIPEEPALSFALANRLDHQTVLDQFDDKKRKVLVAEDSLRTGLALETQANATSKDGKPLQYNFRDVTWSATLTWNLPIDRLPERNAYRRSIVDLEAAGRQCANSQDTIEAGLRDELRTMRTQLEGYQIQLLAVQLAERRVESTKLLIDAGRASTRDLLESEDSLLSARNSATSALIDYTLARLAVWRDLEILRVDSAGIHADAELLAKIESGDVNGPAKPAGG